MLVAVVDIVSGSEAGMLCTKQRTVQANRPGLTKKRKPKSQRRWAPSRPNKPCSKTEPTQAVTRRLLGFPTRVSHDRSHRLAIPGLRQTGSGVTLARVGDLGDLACWLA